MSRARSVADLGNQNVLDLNASAGTLKVGAGATIENTGEVQFAGIVTAATVQIGAATTLHATGLDLGSGNITSHNITSTGNLSVDGNMNVGGVLTYEDVTSVDSVGVITARDGIHVTGGSVGIGTINPATNLTVYGSTSAALFQNSNTGTTGSDGFFVGNYGGLTASVWQYEEDVINFGTNDRERLRITSGGLVGIGTNNPGTTLEVFTDDDTDISDNTGTNNTNSILRLYNKNGSDGTGVNNYTGIRFDVANGATSSAYLNYVRTGDNQGAFLFKARNAASSYPELLRIDSSGRLLVGSTSAVNSAYTSGSIQLRSDVGGVVCLKRNDGINTNSVGILEFHSSFGRSALIAVNNDGTHSGSSTPGEISFQTTPSGIFNAPVECMKLANTGAVTVKRASTHTTGLQHGLAIQQGSATNGNRAGLVFKSLDEFTVAGINGVIETHSGTQNNCVGSLEFYTKPSGVASPIERMSIEAEGETRFYGDAIQYAPNAFYTQTHEITSSWTSYQTIATGLTSNTIYLVSINWHHGSSPNQPYYYATSFLFATANGTNGSGAENEKTFLHTTHTGSPTSYFMTFRGIATSGGGSTGHRLQAKINTTWPGGTSGNTLKVALTKVMWGTRSF